MLNFKAGSESQNKFDRITAAGLALITAECYRASQITQKVFTKDFQQTLAPLKIKNPSKFRI